MDMNNRSADVNIGKGKLAGKGGYATRAFKKGEAITINDKIELRHELDTFLEAYEKAANSCNFDHVSLLIAPDAVFWFTDGTYKGRVAIRKAFQDTWAHIQDENYSISSVKWIVATYWHAVCSYTFTSKGMVDEKNEPSKVGA